MGNKKAKVLKFKLAKFPFSQVSYFGQIDVICGPLYD